MRRSPFLLIMAVSLFCLVYAGPPPPLAWAQPRTGLPAFPGAEGFGAATPGGRGGQVIAVTNLNAAGPGSLRAALTTPGPRIVVFRVGGTIQADHAWQITEPYITVAGQTAPGDGITLRGAPLRIRTHDVIVRGLRIRVGDQTPNLPAPDGVSIGAPTVPVYNVIIDHCSISWALDENLSTYQDAPVFAVSIQWNVISEGLLRNRHPEGEHSMGLLVGDNSRAISVHHNLFAHNNRRNPVIKGGPDNMTTVEVINNVVYNWGERATHFLVGPVAAHIIGNYYQAGPDSHTRQGIHLETNLAAATQLYLHGNVGPGRTAALRQAWVALTRAQPYQARMPAFTPSGITTQSATTAYELVLTYAGATAPQRDDIDQRVVASVRQGRGRLIDSQAQVGGWVPMRAAMPARDSDQDGMPDAWESQHGLQPTVADGARRAPSGYTYVEEYLNELIRIPDRE